MADGNQCGVIVVGPNINEAAMIEWVKKDNPKYVAGTPFINSNGDKCIPINKSA
jgi:hypothetical protein